MQVMQVHASHAVVRNTDLKRKEIYLINWNWITFIIVNLIQDKTLKCVGYSNMISMILDPMIHIHIYTVRAIYALNTCIHSKLSLQFEMLIPPPNPVC